MKHKKKKPSRQKTGAARIETNKVNPPPPPAHDEVVETEEEAIFIPSSLYRGRAIFREVIITTILLAITLAGCLWKVGLIK